MTWEKEGGRSQWRDVENKKRLTNVCKREVWIVSLDSASPFFRLMGF